MNDPRAAGAAFALLLLSTAVSAQEAPSAAPPDVKPAAPVDEGETAEDIVVVAGRERGAIASDVQAELSLDERDIRAFGADSLQDLVQQLSAQTSSSRGRGGEPPVVLVNGRRVSGFREVHSIPSEAIQKFEVFPEETALAYGYRADQRVINVILRPRFQSQTVTAGIGGPTAGDVANLNLGGSVFRVQDDSRLLFDVSLKYSNALLESQRDVVQADPAFPYAIGGNITGLTPGAEIDPALSALAGGVVTVAGVPGSAAALPPTLGQFAATANQPNSTNLGDYRTLSPQTTDFSAGVSIARPLSSKVQMTLSARLTAGSQVSRQGLATANLLLPGGNPWSPFAGDTRLAAYAAAPGALVRDNATWSGRLAAAFNGELQSWRWSLTASHDHDESRTLTDRSLDLSDVQARLLAGDAGYNPFADNAINGPMQRERATSNNDRSLVEAVLAGRVAELPAGGVSTSMKLGLDRRQIHSYAERILGVSEADLQRTQGTAQASLDIPIASRRNDVLQPLGDLSLNGNASVDRYSDFGTFVTWGGGLTWRPVQPLQMIASFTSERGIPTMQQLGNPQIQTPNVRIFDYVTGETVEITRLDGGNPDLAADNRLTWKLGARLKPLQSADIDLQADFVRTRITGPISSFPAATAEIEAAFPDRFIRDSSGQLLFMDNRPVNFARSDRSELRWGFNYTAKLKASKADLEAMARRRAELEKARKEAEASGKPVPGVPAWMQQQRGPGGGPAGRPGGGGFGEGRLMLSLYHSWRFADRVLIRDGLPELDMLNGSAAGGTGGTPRHMLEGRVMANRSGYGGFASVKWQTGTRVLAGPAAQPGAGDLHFSSLTTLNLRLFADLGQRLDLVAKAPWVRGMRVSIGVNNLLNDRVDVRDSVGNTPIGYQPWYMDPVGCSIEISVRKLMF